MSSETDTKVDRVARIARAAGAAGVLLTMQRNFAWVTGGSSNRIDGSREAGAGALLIAADGGRYVIANAIEMPRLLEEALAGLEFTPVEYAWTEDHANPATVIERARSMLSTTSVAADAPLSQNAIVVEHALMRARVDLLDEEVVRFRKLGRDMGVALGVLCRSLRPGTPENEIANAAAAAVHAAGARPIVVLVAADDRLARYRHPVASDAPWRKTLMVVVCAERHGLIVALSRIVSAGSVDPALSDRTHATAHVFARLLEHTQPGASGAELYETARRAYVEAGFADEEKKHHQGGAVGYRSREWIAHPQSQEIVMSRQAFAWNPSITGAKVEDTVLLVNGALELITATPDWPGIEIAIGNRKIAVSGVLALGKE